MSVEANVLVYEDDEACGFTFATILRRAGYKVILANHFNPALEALNAQPAIDLLLADIVVERGGVHGIALARMAKMRNPAIGVVYVTGYDLPGVESEVSGRLLRKPVTDDQLLTAVAAALMEDA